MNKRQFLLTAGAAASGWVRRAIAQDYPTKLIRWVVGYPPGGGTDVVARALATRLAPVLGQSVIVENRPGGNSVIASRAVAASPPDGHTLLLTTDTHAINAAFDVPLPYDSLRDFSFVTQLTTSPLMLMAHPSLGVSSLADLVAAARKSPDKFSFGSLGSSSPHFLIFEWWKSMAGIRIVDIPYKGGGQLLVDNMAGHVGLSLIVAGNGVRQASDGKLVPLAVTSAEPWVAAGRTVPSFAASGYPDLVVMNWYAVLAPAKTPEPTVQRLNDEIRAILKDPATAETLAKVGVQAKTGSPAELEAMVRREIEKYRRIIKAVGAKPEGR